MQGNDKPKSDDDLSYYDFPSLTPVESRPTLSNVPRDHGDSICNVNDFISSAKQSFIWNIFFRFHAIGYQQTKWSFFFQASILVQMIWSIILFWRITAWSKHSTSWQLNRPILQILSLMKTWKRWDIRFCKRIDVFQCRYGFVIDVQSTFQILNVQDC